jgi:hypothetical protein
MCPLSIQEIERTHVIMKKLVSLIVLSVLLSGCQTLYHNANGRLTNKQFLRSKEFICRYQNYQNYKEAVRRHYTKVARKKFPTRCSGGCGGPVLLATEEVCRGERVFKLDQKKFNCRQ